MRPKRLSEFTCTFIRKYMKPSNISFRFKNKNIYTVVPLLTTKDKIYVSVLLHNENLSSLS